MSKNDGGAAFPQAAIIQQDDGFTHSMPAADGMSLRDYFAASIAQGLSSNQEWLNNSVASGLSPLVAIAGASYEVADAMLEARSK